MTSPRYPREPQRGQPSGPPAPLQAVEPTLIIQRPSRRGPVIVASLVATLCAGIALTLFSGGEGEPAGGERHILVSNESNPAANEPDPASPPAPEPGAPAPEAGDEPAAEPSSAGLAGTRTGQGDTPRNQTNERARALAQARTTPGKASGGAPGTAARAGAAAEEATPETTGDDMAGAGDEDSEESGRAGENTGEEASPTETDATRVALQTSPGGSPETGSSGSGAASGSTAPVRRSDGDGARRSAGSRSAGANAGTRASASPARVVAEPPPTSPPPPPPRAQRDLRVPRNMLGDAGRGKGLYGRCQSCHGKSASALSPRRYTQRQWRRYLASRRHGRHAGLGEHFSLSELADVKAYLLENAADVDRGMAAGIR